MSFGKKRDQPLSEKIHLGILWALVDLKKDVVHQVV